MSESSCEQSVSALNRFPRMMQEYMVSRLRANYRANHARVMGLKTRAEALAYCEDVRGKAAAVFGPCRKRRPWEYGSPANRIEAAIGFET